MEIITKLFGLVVLGVILALGVAIFLGSIHLLCWLVTSSFSWSRNALDEIEQMRSDPTLYTGAQRFIMFSICYTVYFFCLLIFIAFVMTGIYLALGLARDVTSFITKE